MIEKLREAGLDAFISQKGTMLRICVGRFASPRDPALKELRERVGAVPEFHDCFVQEL